MKLFLHKVKVKDRIHMYYMRIYKYMQLIYEYH
jgi:hypothetical protein